MSTKRLNALIVISLIIGVSALGVGVFSVIRTYFPEVREHETQTGIVGLWETIESDQSSLFTLILNDIRTNDSDFFSLNNPNTTLSLNQVGWYKVSFRFRLVSLIVSNPYGVQIWKNSLVYQDLEFEATETAKDINDYAYLYSDGDDEFHFECYDAMITDSFWVTSSQQYNQFVLEYVGEV